MSYMRGNPYIYSDGERLQIISDGSAVAMPLETAEELAAMIWFKLDPEYRSEVLVRTYEKHALNTGCDGVAKEIGVKDIPPEDDPPYYVPEEPE